MKKTIISFNLDLISKDFILTHKNGLVKIYQFFSFMYKSFFNDKLMTIDKFIDYLSNEQRNRISLTHTNVHYKQNKIAYLDRVAYTLTRA